MGFINAEFKAHISNLADLEIRLEALHPRFLGEDHQIDTYFQVPHGRLKWRRGVLENALIYYIRANQAEIRTSQVMLEPIGPQSALPEMLLALLPILVVVDKKRRIYRIDNVKIHLDEVQGLGAFMEVEAIDEHATGDEAALREQAEFYRNALGIPESSIVRESYSDLLLHAGH